MAQSYKELQKQIESLQKQADKLRAQEVDGVVSRIKVAIAHYGLSAGQLGFGAASAGKRKALAKKSGPASALAKYADGAGRSWSGRGPRPAWLREALANGKSLQDFASAAAPTEAGTKSETKSKSKAKAKAKAKRKTQIRYRDQAGNAWSGMGPQPRWLKAALAAGTQLEQLAA
jgi:DNA-binding protein H-NS